MITIQHIQERLCAAYIEAIAAAAGVNLVSRGGRDYGFDGTFHAVKKTRGNRFVESGFPLDFQAKATINWQHRDAAVVYDLEVKTYNDLVDREPEATSCVLLLLCLPSEQSDWLFAEEQGLVLRHCCYWTFLEGAMSSNHSTQRIEIPRANLLTIDALGGLLHYERQRRMAM